MGLSILFLFFTLITIALSNILLGINLEVLQCFGLIFLEYLLKVIVVLAGQDILVFLNEVLVLNFEVLGFLLDFTLFESGFDFLAFLEEVFFVLFGSEFLLFFFKADFLGG